MLDVANVVDVANVADGANVADVADVADVANVADVPNQAMNLTGHMITPGPQPGNRACPVAPLPRCLATRQA